MKRVFFRILIALIVATILYVLFWPVKISPVAWMPPPAPELTGVYAQNDSLKNIDRLPIAGFAPEDVAFDRQDRIYCGDDLGNIWRFQPDGTRPEIFVSTKGRPLGLIFDHDDNLIVADAVIGLMSIAPD